MKLFLARVLFLLSLTFAAASLHAEEKVWSVGTDLELNSRYIWRGFFYSEGVVFQPAFWVSAFDFTFTVWNNLVLNDEEAQGQINEIDLYLDYEHEFGNLTVSPSLWFYTYPGFPDPDTGEMAVKLAYQLGPFVARTTQVMDFLSYDGAYYGDAGMAFKHEFNKKISMEIYSGIGWGSNRFNEAYGGLSQGALNLMESSAYILWQVNEHLSFKPHLAFTAIVDKNLRQAQSESRLWYGGLTTGLEF